MTDIILHHYYPSPYAGKIRKLLGIKGLAWHSVIIPQIMPKPDLTALTGGYRMTPVLQLGANIHCDSHHIAARLERLAPTPALYPVSHRATIAALEQWGNSLFLPSIVILIGVGGYIDDDFLADRNKIMPTALDAETARAMTPSCLGQLSAALHAIERQLSCGGPFLLGTDLTAADLAVHTSVSTLFLLPEFSDLIKPLKKLAAWQQRMADMPPSTRSEMSSADALAIARASDPDIGESNALSGSNLELGETLRVTPEYIGKCPVEGELAQLCENEIVLLRRTKSLGDIAIHFPRSGFVLEKLS